MIYMMSMLFVLCGITLAGSARVWLGHVHHQAPVGSTVFSTRLPGVPLFPREGDEQAQRAVAGPVGTTWP